MRDGGPVVAAIVVAAAVGLAIGFLPWAVTDFGRPGFILPDMGNPFRGAAFVGIGSFVLALVLAAAIGQIDAVRRGVRLWVLVTVVVPAVLIGVVLGEATYVSGGIPLGTMATMTVVLLVIVVPGVVLGYRIGRVPRGDD